MSSLWARIKVDAIEVSNLGRVCLIPCPALISGIVRFDERLVGHHGARGRRCDANYREAKQMAPPNSDLEMLLHNYPAPELICGSIDRAEPALIAIVLLAIVLRKLSIIGATYLNDLEQVRLRNSAPVSCFSLGIP
jgi:hypothetical protein